MDASGDSTHNGNGHPDSQNASLPSADAVPKGAPVTPAPSADAAGAPPKPLAITFDVDPPPAPPKPVKLKRAQLAFLAAREEGHRITGAAKAAKIAKQTYYNWINATDAEGNPTPEALAFRAADAEAFASGTDELVDEARRRAKDGWDEPVFDKMGRPCGVIRRYDSKLLQFLISQRDASFRQRYEFTGANGSPLNPSKVEHTVSYDLSALSDQELETHNALLEKCLARSGGTPPSGAN